MSEGIKLCIEKDISDLEDLLKDIDSDVLKGILKQRVKYEYRINRRGASKEDFLKAIEIEKSLEKKLFDQDGGRNKRLCYRVKKLIFNKIAALYQRCLVRHGEELDVWMSFFDFAASNEAHNLCHNIFRKMTQLHPLNPRFWILYSRWLYNKQGDIQQARLNLRKALMLNSNCAEILIALLELEFNLITPSELDNKHSPDCLPASIFRLIEIFLAGQDQQDSALSFLADLILLTINHPSTLLKSSVSSFVSRFITFENWSSFFQKISERTKDEEFKENLQFFLHNVVCKQSD